MKQKIFNGLIILSFFVLFFEVLFHKTLVFDTISYSLNIWINTLIPSMFPFFIISDILINYQIINYIPKFIKKYFCKIFKVGEQTISIFFLSLFSGFPSSARNIKTLYDQNLITKEEASHALAFTHFANPLFVLSTIAVLFLNNEKYGYIILISHYLGNIIIGILSRNLYTNNNSNYKPIINKNPNFSNTLIKAIKSSIDTLLLILGTLTCFLILSSLIIKHLNINPYTSALIKGILEMTMGLKAISILSLPDIYKVVISTMFISFGGLAVHLQVLSQLIDTKISYQPFLIARIFHAIISGSICYLLFLIFFV